MIFWPLVRPHVKKGVLSGLRKAEVEAFATARFMELRGSERGEVEQLREYGRALRAARKALS